ncbi:MAG: hypothetical protein HY343_12460 [Lentisphaerae bacterium]|nr:hypothetical protein [Lentisphaerota bacterium]
MKMKTRSKIVLVVLPIVCLASIIAATDVYRTLNNARTITALEAARFDDCFYVGTRLSYDQIYTPPSILRFPHWEVTYNSTNPLHRVKQFVTFSQARANAKPLYVKLANFTNDTVSARLVWPEAVPWSFNLLLAISNASPSNYPLSRICPEYKGKVVVRDSTGAELGEYSISSTTAQQCNWLTDRLFDAFIAGPQTKHLNTSMRVGKEYEITVTIPSRPKEFASLWLECVQTEKQRKKDQQTNR